MDSVLMHLKADEFAEHKPVRASLCLTSLLRECVLVTLVLTLSQPALAGESKSALSFEDQKEIMELADKVEAAVLIPDEMLLLKVTNPKYGLSLDLFSDTPNGVEIHIPYEEIANMFTNFKDVYWGGDDAGDFDWYSDIPSVLLGPSGGSVQLRAQYPGVKNQWRRIVSLAQSVSYYDSKVIDQLTVEPINHFFVYEDEHYVQYFVQSPISETSGEYWFLIIDKDEDGWFLKSITHMERFSM